MTADTARRADPLHRDDPRTLGGYHLTGRLGAGGMGVVYLGRADDGRYVAIKLVHGDHAGDEDFRRRFRGEVNRARQVPPFCTAAVIDADLEHDPPYLVVEYVDGPTLAEAVEQHGTLTAGNLHSLAIGVATALAAIHGAGVIHRDLKPRNVLLAPDSPKVIDFGIARTVHATGQHTTSDQMLGTVAYMAPERFESAPGTPPTPAADVFAWGVVVAYAATGRTPFSGDSPAATAGRILTQPPDLDGLGEPLRAVVRRALAKNPADRPTARQLVDLLLAQGAPRSTRAPETAQRRPALRSATGATPSAGQPARRPRPGRIPVAATRPRRPRRPYRAPVPAAAVARMRTARVVAQVRAARSRGLAVWQWIMAVTAALLIAGIGTGAIIAGNVPTTPDVRVAAPALPGAAADSVLGRGPARPAGSSATSPAGSRALSAALPGAAPLATRDLTGTMTTVPSWIPGSQAPGSRAPGTRTPGTRTWGEPADPVAVIRDPLSTPGLWRDSGVRDPRANCVIRGTMRVTRADRGAYRCSGPATILTGDHSIAVDTTLLTAGSCAALWFRWSTERGGYLLRTCQHRLTVGVDRRAGKRVLAELPLATPIALNRTTRVRLVIDDGDAHVFRDDSWLGAVPLTEPDLVGGEAGLGISIDTRTDSPPYTVTFADVDIRHLRN